MDPNRTLWEILEHAQQIGQPATKEEILLNLSLIVVKAENLAEWIKNGGFKPDLPVSIEMV